MARVLVANQMIGRSHSYEMTLYGGSDLELQENWKKYSEFFVGRAKRDRYAYGGYGYAVTAKTERWGGPYPLHIAGTKFTGKDGDISHGGERRGAPSMGYTLRPFQRVVPEKVGH